MKKILSCLIHPVLAATAVGLSACAAADDADDPLVKGLIDRAQFRDGVDVSLVSGSLASFEIFFAGPPPEVTDDEFASAMESAASVQILDVPAKRSEWLTSTMVDAEPQQPGEYRWAVAADRTQASFIFYSDLSRAVVLQPAGMFRIYLRVYTNPYVAYFSELASDAYVQASSSDT